jgi:hypothetical protein
VSIFHSIIRVSLRSFKTFNLLEKVDRVKRGIFFSFDFVFLTFFRVFRMINCFFKVLRVFTECF